MINKLWLDILLHIVVIGAFLYVFMPQIFIANAMAAFGYIIALSVILKVAEMVVLKD